jgi:uncharacterized protein (DUF58 family)
VRKRSVSIDFVTVVARILTHHGNRVGAALYGETMDSVIPTGSGRRHVLHILHRMLHRPLPTRSTATNLQDFLRAAFPLISRRSLVFVVSDFFSAAPWTDALAHLALRHEVLAVRLYDPLEHELPDIGLLTMQDAETGEQIFVDTHDRGFRRRFIKAAEEREARIRAGFRDSGVDALELSTNDDLADAIMRFADLRKRRSHLAAGAVMPRTFGNDVVPLA